MNIVDAEDPFEEKVRNREVIEWVYDDCSMLGPNSEKLSYIRRRIKELIAKGWVYFQENRDYSRGFGCRLEPPKDLES